MEPIVVTISTILVVVASLSIAASLLTIYLIHVCGRWSGFLIVIYSMSVSQIIYCLTFYFVASFSVVDAGLYIPFSSSFGYLSVTLWTNVLSGIVLYIVGHNTTIDMWKRFPQFCLVAIGAPLLFAILTVTIPEGPSMDNLDISFNVICIISFAFNLAVYFIITRKLYMLGSADTTAKRLLTELSGRLKYYPICQVITRAPVCFYQLRYGFKSNNYSTSFDTSQTVALFFHAIFLPSAGIGYFIVFICMQRQAQHQLRRMFKAVAGLLCWCDNGNGATKRDSLLKKQLSSFHCSDLGEHILSDSSDSDNYVLISYTDLTEDELGERILSQDRVVEESAAFHDMDADRLYRFHKDNSSTHSFGNFQSQT